MGILETAPDGVVTGDYHQSYFEALLPCMITANEQVRRATAKVEDRIFANPVLMEQYIKSDKLKEASFKQYVWTLT